jgi:hypothetical protein
MPARGPTETLEAGNAAGVRSSYRRVEAGERTALLSCSGVPSSASDTLSVSRHHVVRRPRSTAGIFAAPTGLGGMPRSAWSLCCH